jgi:hypothetical protein
MLDVNQVSDNEVNIDDALPRRLGGARRWYDYCAVSFDKGLGLGTGKRARSHGSNGS